MSAKRARTACEGNGHTGPVVVVRGFGGGSGGGVPLGRRQTRHSLQRKHAPPVVRAARIAIS